MREFDIINKFFKPIACPDSAGLSDDCAFFEGYCVTKDMLVAGVHFFASDAPYDLARKSLRVNLSDLAASGAEPFGFMLGLALPKTTDEKWLAEFAAGLKSDITKYKIQLLGGDTAYHDGELTISITAIGKCEKPVTRGGAKVGDNIFVSGAIGGGYIGLQTKIKNQSSKAEKYDLPNPRIDLIPIIRKHANSCIDISDGLLGDLGHICDESGVGAEIFSDKIPLFSKEADVMAQITGGDDYELLFTSGFEEIAGCTTIGRITESGVITLDGNKVEARGYEHATSIR